MRILLLTHKAERHYHFCNRIIENTDRVVGVITGGKRVNRSRYQKVRRRLSVGRFASSLRNWTLNLAFAKYGRMLSREKRAAEETLFAGSADRFRARYGQLHLAHVSPPHRSINSDHYVSLIRAAKPDVIAVMGTCLIGKKILSSCDCVVNMHTGLSPYYRGGNTNLWPFVEDDYGYFGVTIHLMSDGIDSGDIVFTARPKIEIDDDFGAINTKCISIGTELMIRTLKLFEAGKLSAMKQWTEGKLFHNRDMNDYVAYRYYMKKKEFLSQYVRLQSANKLPDLLLVNEGAKADGPCTPAVQ